MLGSWGAGELGEDNAAPILYLHGRGVAENPGHAMQLFRKAVAKGSAGAANNLA